MAKIVLITGGARSGKSSFAEKLASTLGKDVIFLATAEAMDKEMADRIKKHKSKRSLTWKTVEEPININILNKFKNFEGAVILDCVTLWLSNMIHKFGVEGAEDHILGDIRTLLKTVKTSKFTLIVVSNELGLGIVPENRLAREFRDIAGRCNQLIACMADEVYFMVSGIELKIKG
ncbi:MAG: bifunctional adenosylcobinamide kinase/adenosylcobinamide-phosphate guanylyltransferase [bacterium]|nr:bifunctional adenosylcobinamide kinase/adenosylcobinamide-phosphate guanylyltransferase [bacterium]